MNTTQALAFGTLWIVLFALAALVLVLYRQVERAYRDGRPAAVNALPAGSDAPPVSVISEGAIRTVSAPEEPTLIVFVTSSCAACRETMRLLMGDPQLNPGRTLVFITGQGYEHEARDSPPGTSLFAVASPADVNSDYRLTVVPMIYLVTNRRVVAATSDGSVSGLQTLLGALEPVAIGSAPIT